jgi:hypothetical protein
MAGYRPSVELKIAKPCSESWEAMDGDSRVRHCAACDRDVLNLASMTPANIEAIFAKGGPLPCMRVVRLEDGGLLTAQVAPRASVLTRLVAAISATIMVPVVAAQTAQSPERAVTLQGKVQDPAGATIPNATVQLRHGAEVITTATDIHGRFAVSAPPGRYELVTTMRGFVNDSETIQLNVGSRELTKPITLRVGMIEVGEVVAIPIKTRKAKKLPVAAVSAVSATPPAHR